MGGSVSLDHARVLPDLLRNHYYRSNDPAVSSQSLSSAAYPSGFISSHWVLGAWAVMFLCSSELWNVSNDTGKLFPGECPIMNRHRNPQRLAVLWSTGEGGVIATSCYFCRFYWAPIVPDAVWSKVKVNASAPPFYNGEGSGFCWECPVVQFCLGTRAEPTLTPAQSNRSHASTVRARRPPCESLLRLRLVPNS